MIDIEKDAKEILANAKKQRQDISQKPEARGAGADSSPEKEKTKEKEEKKVAVNDIEEQAKKDEEILTKKDEDLDESQKVRKTELVKIKSESDDKDKKSNVQKRIDELIGKVKNLESTNATSEAEKQTERAKRKVLEAEINELQKQLSMTPADKIKEKIKSEASSRINKYIEEDKGLPRENRREMTKAELDDWALEDYESVNEWIAKRTYRRLDEEKQIKTNISQEVEARKILTSQNVSLAKTFIRHPELDVLKRMKELQEQGKSQIEIKDTLCKENPKYKLCLDVYAENPDKYILSPDAPELIMKEMESRLEKSNSSNKKQEEYFMSRECCKSITPLSILRWTIPLG